MRLHQLTITAFGPFATTQRVDFDALAAAGLFLFHGPTGSGKTSILDAVCFALYGSVPGARQSTGTVSLRSDHAAPGTPTEVVLELTVGGRRLEVTRRPEQERPKKRGGGMTRDRAVTLLREWDAEAGLWRGLSRSHQEVGEELGRLLGMSREQFCQVVLLPQGEFAEFLRAGAEKRAKLLGRLFDTGRFAAAEAHLSELRARAGARVRDGDERLLAVAHRVQQAAGRSASPGGDARSEAGEWGQADEPLGQAGDPELADGVLRLAAWARCEARERLDVAALALGVAEEGHAAAQATVAEARERARLARRRAEAAARAEALDAARPERDAVRGRLERARAADAVAPALALREGAEAEHREAVEAERRARARLPAAQADAPAAHLAERERATRESLGALAGARQAEDRARRLAEELARLAEQIGAGEELLRGTEEEVAAWPATRERLERRVDRARQAAARVERAAESLAHARRRLAAARRRDELAEAAGEAERRLLAARERAAGAYEHWLELKERRLRGIAAELAAALRPGEPCAVCGSAEHPSPARATADHVGREAEEAALAAHRAAEERREEADRALTEARAAHAAARAEARGGAEGGAEGVAGGGVRDTDSDTGRGAVPGAGRNADADQVPVPVPDQVRASGPGPDPYPGGGPTVAPHGSVDAGGDADGEARPDAVPAPGAEPGAFPGWRGDVGPDPVSSMGVGVGVGVDGKRDGGPVAEGDPDAARGRVPAPRGEPDPDPDVARLVAVVEELAAAHAAAEAEAAGESAARRALADAERDHAALLSRRQAAERDAAALASRRETLAAEHQALQAEVAAARGGAPSVAARAEELARRADDLTAASSAVRLAEETADRLKQADGALADAAFRAGFDTPRAAADAVLGAAEQEAARRRLDAWQAEEAAVAALWEEAGATTATASAAAATEAAEAAEAVETASAALAAATARLRTASAVEAAARDRVAALDALSSQAAAEATALAPLRAEYQRLHGLATLATGTSPRNAYKMRLETYVLAARLEQVAAAATARLHRMSAGRYSLVHSDARASQGARSGLGLRVVDAWTGRARETASLSGGESFCVSLALALGLADVVAQEAGGARLDTLFVDEGFGSLDEDSLDEVLDVLDSLREQDRSVAIVSHVPDLRARVLAQLEVVKTRHGSTVRHHTRAGADPGPGTPKTG
ncbi:AAA family ATPase [Streptomyces sp. 4N509B]|uniref:AAA family ATPase n=1 Tax=Streptomyces sp. 4N509B TaxID=3457413 RepID=UPI003FD1ADCC